MEIREQYIILTKDGCADFGLPVTCGIFSAYTPAHGATSLHLLPTESLLPGRGEVDPAARLPLCRDDADVPFFPSTNNCSDTSFRPLKYTALRLERMSFRIVSADHKQIRRRRYLSTATTVQQIIIAHRALTNKKHAVYNVESQDENAVSKPV
jgi:hypothetical protein